MPSSCHLSDRTVYRPYLQFQVTYDGQTAVGSVQSYGLGESGTVALPLPVPPQLSNPLASTTHSISVGVIGTTCAAPGEEIAVTALEIEVVTFR
jgi:hypothetical protein